MGKHIVLAGGGHAHMTCMLKAGELLSHGHRITLLSASPYHYYSGMGPGMLSGIYRPQEIRFNVKKMAENRGAKYIEDKVIRIDPDRHILYLISGETLHYDIVSFNTGSDVPTGSMTIRDSDIYTVKPIINLLKARDNIVEQLRKKSLDIVVIGGGAAGVEIAGNVWRLVKDNGGNARISLIAGTKLMGRFPDRVRKLAVSSFKERAIEVIEGDRVKNIEKDTVILTSGKKIKRDIVFPAMGVKPSSLFRDSGLPTGSDGGLLVNSHLHSVAHTDVLGGGDCISLAGHDLAKVGVYAVRQNPILFHNLMASANGKELATFEPGGNYLLIFNMGDNKGIFWRDNIVWGGKLAFRLKDHIDRKFMRKFQVSGELNEK
jgi:NADH dehydrogenase FAD-containing subunit